MFVTTGFTIALGFWQTVAEDNRGTWLFLLHRPASFKKIIGVKLAVGAGVYFIVSTTAILVYAAWAITPGTHASPFYWWMTEDVWGLCGFGVLIYLSAFLSGFRLGRWFGTRLLPLAGFVFIASTIPESPFYIAPLIWNTCEYLLIIAFLVYMIFDVSQTRDFS